MALQAQVSGTSNDAASAPAAAPAKSGSSLGRKLSFGRKEKKPPAESAPQDNGAAAAAPPPQDQPKEELKRKGSFGLTRVLSFGKSKKEPSDANGEPRARSGSTAGNLVRKLSFGKKK